MRFLEGRKTKPRQVDDVLRKPASETARRLKAKPLQRARRSPH